MHRRGFKIVKSGISSIRFYSLVKSLGNYPESVALEHINSGKPTTSLIINKILSNQNIVVTDSKLNQLLKVKGVELDLPISTPENSLLLDKLTGKSIYKGFFGVYIFIHKNTGDKYVGSSNLLRRRMEYYFIGNSSLGGLFLPLLRKEGLKAFKLIVFKLDSNKFSSQDALILEQYFLLNKEFNLNTLRVVNAGSSKGDAVYVYDLTCSTLYYQAKSKIDLKRVLNIHTETTNKYLDSRIPYLNKFLLLSCFIPTAFISNISTEELIDIMQKERQNMYTIGTRRSIAVELKILPPMGDLPEGSSLEEEGNTFVDHPGHTLNFDSLTSCIEYLKGLGLTIKRDTLTRYIKMGKVFHNFSCKYRDNILPDNFEEVGLIIDEYLKLKTDMNTLKVNRKNKPILVKGLNFEQEFESILGAIKFFDSLNIKLYRKTLYLRLKDGKIYKNYSFSYK